MVLSYKYAISEPLILIKPSYCDDGLYHYSVADNPDSDMMSNMTETQAVEMYERMSGARPESLQDEIMQQ